MTGRAQTYDVVVLGAGVIGLTTALVLQERGYRVVIAARDLPEDLKSTEFASPWAGCNWYPFEYDPASPASIREAATFPYLADLSKRHPELCQRIPFYSVWDHPKPAREAESWFANIVGDFEPVPAPIPGNKANGRRFTSFILHAPDYITHLASVLRSRNVTFVRTTLESLHDAARIDGVGSSTVIINALGLGTRWLKGVEDAKVHPARGQTVLVRAEGWERVCVMHTEGFYPKPGESLPEPAYIIPRPGSEPNFILGGTYLRDNYDTVPDPKTAQRIIIECTALMRNFVRPGCKAEDVRLEVISHNVGLRPARDGGARIEVERLGSWAGSGVGSGDGERGVVHAYGFGSAGYQQSYGAAQQVADLVDGLVSQKKASL